MPILLLIFYNTDFKGDEEVFKRLHTKFTWMLQAGAHIYTETLYSSQDLLKKLDLSAGKQSIFEPSACSVPNDEDCMPLRTLEKLVSKQLFRVLMYCALIDVNVSTSSNNYTCIP